MKVKGIQSMTEVLSATQPGLLRNPYSGAPYRMGHLSPAGTSLRLRGDLAKGARSRR
jgi:hypothetical protein